MTDQTLAQTSGKSMTTRLIPVVIIAALAVAAWLAGVGDFFTKESIIANKDWVVATIEANPILTGLAFAAIYAALVALSLPVASGLTLISGILFGAWWGFAWAFLGAMGGATTVYLVARFAFGDMMQARAGGWVGKLEAGFRENEFSFMLLLRLIIIVPFFVLNIAAGVLNVKFHNYFIATAVGIIPATLLKTFLVGGEIRDAFLLRSEWPDLGSLLADPRLWVALIALGLIAILPIVAKRFSGDRIKELQS